MEYIYPDYYDEFRCTADQCPNTCCAGWQIYIDEKSLKKYLKQKGPFGSRLKNSIDAREGCFHRYDNRCAFLNEENLCDICLEMGEQHLCRTCEQYPRHTEEYENVREVSLSLSCPEAARIMLGKEDKTTFIHEEKEEENDDYDSFDFFLYTKLLDIRSCILDVIQNRKYSMGVRMSFAVAMMHDIQRRITSGRLFEVDDLLKKYKAKDFMDKTLYKFETYENKADERYELIQEMLMTLHELEVLQDDWSGTLWNDEWLLYGTMTKTEYQDKRRDFLKENPKMEIWKEQICVYFIFTYFCGAVYDEKAYTKLKVCLIHIMLMEELLFAKRVQKGKPLITEEVIDCVHRYARETEHSDWNLEYMEKMAGTRPVFGLENMLIGLLNG